MRILMVHQPIDGGVARHVADLFEGLTANGHEVVLCGPALPSASLLASSVPASAPRAPLAIARSISPAADLTALRRFAGIVPGVKPDLIHAHSSKAGGVARLGRVLHPRVPVLYTPHGYAFAGFFEHEFERRLYREAERLLALLSSGVVAVCEAEARLAATLRARRPISMVHNGIEPPPEGPPDPRVQALAERAPVICTITQLRPGKGVETLIDALPAVLAQHPRVQVAIAGDGPLRESLSIRARERGVAAAIHFLGEHADPIAVLRGADVFLLSSWAESFPYAILEAMAVRLPVVSTDVGGIPEAITDRESGLLVPAKDAAATARALLELLDRDELRARLGAAAERVVRLRFNRQQMVDGVARVYEHVTSGRAAR